MEQFISIFYFLFTFIIILMIVWKMKKRIYGNASFDERQLALRGDAYRTALYTTLFALILNGMFKEVYSIEWAAPLTEVLLIISVGIIASTVQCVIKDAYFPQAFNQKRFVWIYTIIGLINLISGIQNILLGESFDEQGRFDNTFLVISILNFSILLITLIHRIFIARREEEEE